MHWKRILALFCAMIYISAVGAAAVETPTEQAGQVVEMPQDMPETDTSDGLLQADGETDAASVVTAPTARAMRVVASTHKVQVNGKAVNPQAYNIDGYNYFKLRDVAYMLNGTSASFNVTWDSAQNAVNLLSGQPYTTVGGEMTVASSTSLRVQASTAKVLIDGKGISIKGYNINGNNYYKIADVSSAIGFTAAFESATQTVQIKTAAVVSPEDPEIGTQPTPDPETPEDEPFVTGVYQVKVDTTLSIRSGPGTGYAVVGQLANGAQVIVDSISNGWAHIRNTNGYCSADYLVRVRDYDSGSSSNTPDEPDEPDTPDEDETEDTPFVPGVYQVKVDSTLAVRAGPATKYAIVGRLKNGDEVVVDELADGWAHLMDTSAGTDRYCSADYLVRVRDYDESEGEPEDPVQPPRTSHLDGKMTVIVDAGHGGSDVGAHNEDESLDEKHVNLYVAQYLQDYLEQEGVRVIMVRDTLEDGSSLSMRGTVMEQYASSVDLFFSIHHNAANTTARGAEVLAQIADKNGGPTKLLGEALLDEYSALGVPIRQVVFKEGTNGDYYYTNRAAASLCIPAVTSEFCFIDNVEDQKFIDSEEDWQAEARAQCNAILYYFSQVEY